MPKPMDRRSPRIEIRLEASISLNGATWQGTALNLSLGGVYMIFDEPVSVTEDQPIQLGLLTQAGMLEIRGRIRDLREATSPRTAGANQRALGLAVEFEKLAATKEQIFASLLDGLREQSVSVKIIGSFLPHETMDHLLEISSAGTEAVHATGSRPASPVEAGICSPERRLVPRADLAIPLHVVPCDTFPGIGQLPAQTVNLSVNGVCIRLTVPPDLLGQRFLLNLSLPKVLSSQMGVIRSDASGYTFTGEVAWTAPVATVPVDLMGSPSAGAYRIGIRLLHHRTEGRRKIAELVEHALTFPDWLAERPEAATITSNIVECLNRAGRRIVASHDSPVEIVPGTPLVIIAPGFGETKKDYLFLAYCFAGNGFHVLRFDYTNQAGESDGEVVDATLTSMNQDLRAIMDYAKQVWPTSPIVVVAASLSGRVALKRAAQDHRADLVVLLTSVVDLQTTLVVAHQEDYMIKFLRGVHLGVMNLLGLNVDADRFLADAIKEGYANLQTAVLDAQQIRVPVLLFTAEHDAWVRLEGVKEVLAALREPSSKLHIIPDAQHVLHENPRNTRAVFQHIVVCCMERLYRGSSHKELKKPPAREISLQHRREREHVRAVRAIGQSDLMEFWRDYLDHFDDLVNVYDYWQFLDHIYRLMGPLPEKARILDAGCGTGGYGTLVLVNQAYRQRSGAAMGTGFVRYVGVDFLESALTKARVNLSRVAAEIQATSPATGSGPSLMEGALVCADLNSALPFRENQFDRIVCNLAISYLGDPLFAIGELLRVLAPKGRMLITSLKPHADLFQIYRNVLQRGNRSEDIEDAQQLLIKLSEIKRAEGVGTGRFFDKQDLAMLLIAGGADHPQIYSGFANQAYVAVVAKPDMARAHPIEPVPPRRIPLGEGPLDSVGGLSQHRESRVLPLEVERMEPVNEYQFYRLGAMLHSLSEIKVGTRLSETATRLFQAQNELVSFLNDRVVPLVLCKPAGLMLLGEIAKLLKALPQGQEKELDHVEVYNLTNGVREFETVFSAEVQSLTAYVIPQKGIFSTPDLVGRAENLLPEAARKLIPGQALADIRQAGRCLAVDLPTAAGFHILRATETVVREYYRLVVKKQPKPVARNWGPYIRILRRNDGDPKILALLEQIRALYQNPTVYPEAVLSFDEVTALLGLAQSAILAITVDMEKRRKLSASAALPRLV